MVFPKKNRPFFTLSLLTLIFGIVLITCWYFHIFFHKDITGFGADSLKLVFCLVLFGAALLFIQNRVMATNLEEIIKERTTDFQKSEEKYHSLIEHASDAIYVLDSGRNFTHVNNSMCKMTGYNQEELLQMNVADIIDPEELKIDPLPKVKEQLHSVVRERRFVRKNGQVFTVEVNVKQFTDNMILVIARDITDRKNAEESILREKVLSDTIINSLPGIFYLQNAQGEYLDWRAAGLISILILTGFYLPQTKTTSLTFMFAMTITAFIPSWYAYRKLTKIKSPKGKMSLVKSFVSSRSRNLMLITNMLLIIIGFAARQWHINFLNPIYYHPVFYVAILSFFVIYGLSAMRLCRQELKLADQ